MPFVDLPELGVCQYACVNPVWRYGASQSTAPAPGNFDTAKPTLFVIHCAGSSTASSVRQFQDARLTSTFNLIAMDAAFCGWTTVEQKEEDYPIERVAVNFIAALDKLFPNGLKFSILAEGYLGAHCATWMAVSRRLTQPRARPHADSSRSQHKRPEQVQALIFASPCGMSE